MRAVLAYVLYANEHRCCLFLPTHLFFPICPSRDVRALPSARSDTKSVTGVPARRLTRPDDLDDLAPPQAVVPRDGVLEQDTRQLGLLQAVPLEQGGLLLLAEDDVGGDEVVVGDVDQQVLEQEALDLGVGGGGADGLARLRGQRADGNHNTGAEVARRHGLHELLDLLDAHVVLGHELDVDLAALGIGVRVRRRGRWCGFPDHLLAWAGGELKARTAAGFAGPG